MNFFGWIYPSRKIKNTNESDIFKYIDRPWHYNFWGLKWICHETNHMLFNLNPFLKLIFAFKKKKLWWSRFWYIDLPTIPNFCSNCRVSRCFWNLRKNYNFSFVCQSLIIATHLCHAQVAFASKTLELVLFSWNSFCLTFKK